MKELKKLIEERASLLEDIKKISEQASTEKRDLTTEENTRFDKLSDDIISKEKEIARMKKIAEFESEPANPPEQRDEKITPEERSERENKIFRKVLLQGDKNLNDEDRKEFNEFLNPEKRTTNSGQTVASPGTGTAGGILVPTTLVTELTKALKQYGGARQLARIVTTSTGNPMDFPTMDDTSNAGELIAEQTQVAAQLLTFGKVTLNAYKFSSKLITMSREFIQDEAVDIVGMIADICGERIGRAENPYHTTGTGTSQPKGFITGGSNSGASAASTAVTRGAIIDLIHSVDPAYRESGKCFLTFNDSTLKAIMKLTIGTADDTPLWNPGLAAWGMANGVPPTIQGYRYVINQDMASIGSATKSMAFGDFSRFLIRDVVGFRLVQLNERYAEFDQVAFIMFHRTDSNVLTTGAIKYLQHTTT